MIEILSLPIGGNDLDLQDSAHQLQLKTGSPDPNQILPEAPRLHPLPKYHGVFQKAITISIVWDGMAKWSKNTDADLGSAFHQFICCSRAAKVS